MVRTTRKHVASTSSSGRRALASARHVLPVLHRASDLRRGCRDHHRDRGTRRHDCIAGAAVSDDHAGTGDRAGHLSWRRLEDACRLGCLADRAADQRRRQHAVHVVDQLLDGATHADRLFLARHQSGYRTGAGAEPRQPGDAPVAVRRGSAGRQRAEEIVLDHDAGGGVREERSLQRELCRQLRQRVRARRVEACRGGRAGTDPRRAEPGHAHLDES